MPGRVFGLQARLRMTFRFALIIAVLFVPVNSLLATSCSMAQPHEPDDAEKALLAADYARAVDLYQTKLASHPGDAELTAGLVRALLHQQKVQEAADAVKASLAVAPNSAGPDFVARRGGISAGDAVAGRSNCR